MPLYPVSTLTNGSPTDLDQLIDALTGRNDIGAIQAYAQLSPPGALTAAINTTSGNLTGTFQYKVALVSGYWQGPTGTGTINTQGNTGGGTASNTVSPSAQQSNLSAIPIGGIGVVARIIYRTKANGSTFYFLTQINDNVTTTWTDNIADSSLTVVMPSTNTTGSYFSGDGHGLTNLPWSGITGTPTTLSGYGVTAVPWSTLTGKPTTITGYGITDNLVGSITAGSNISVTNPTGLGAAAVGITGVIPLANGGTGSATQNFADLTTAQTIGGVKTFSGLSTFNAGATIPAAQPFTNNGTFAGSAILPVSMGGTGSATQNFVDLSSSQQSIGGNKKFTGQLTTTNNILDNGAGLMDIASAGTGYNGNMILRNKDANSVSGLFMSFSPTNLYGGSIVAGGPSATSWDIFTQRMVLSTYANGAAGTGLKGVVVSLQGSSEGAQDFRVVSGNTLAGTVFTVDQSGNGTLAGALTVNGSGGSFANSLATNGYQKLPGGFIKQWGIASGITNAGVAMTFPITFPTAVYSVQVTALRASPIMTSFTNPTTSGCTLYTDYAAGQTVYWEALGK